MNSLFKSETPVNPVAYIGAGIAPGNPFAFPPSLAVAGIAPGNPFAFLPVWMVAGESRKQRYASFGIRADRQQGELLLREAGVLGCCNTGAVQVARWLDAKQRSCEFRLVFQYFRHNQLCPDLYGPYLA